MKMDKLRQLCYTFHEQNSLTLLKSTLSITYRHVEKCCLTSAFSIEI